MLLRLSIVLCVAALSTSIGYAQTVVNGAYGPMVVPTQPLQQNNFGQQQFQQQQNTGFRPFQQQQNNFGRRPFQQQQQQFVPQQQQFMPQQQQQFMPQQQQQFMPQQQQQFMPQQQQQFMQQGQTFQNRPQQGFANSQQQGRPLAGKLLNFIANEIQPSQSGAKNTGAQILGMIGNHLDPQQQQQQQFQQSGSQPQRVPGGFYSQQSNGINNQSIHHADSAFAAGREAGKANSTFQRTTIVDANGNPVGYNDTQSWKNAQTGQLHYNSNSHTANSAGGIDKRTGFGLTGGR